MLPLCTSTQINSNVCSQISKFFTGWGAEKPRDDRSPLTKTYREMAKPRVMTRDDAVSVVGHLFQGAGSGIVHGANLGIITTPIAMVLPEDMKDALPLAFLSGHAEPLLPWVQAGDVDRLKYRYIEDGDQAPGNELLPPVVANRTLQKILCIANNVESESAAMDELGNELVDLVNRANAIYMEATAKLEGLDLVELYSSRNEPEDLQCAASTTTIEEVDRPARVVSSTDLQ